MSQNPGPYPSYPSPYQYPPGYGYDPMQAALAPARRAGVMMIVLGSLMLTGGLCCSSAFLVPPEQIAPQLQQISEQTGQEVTIEQVRLQIAITIAVLAGLGLPMIILGILVRSGGSGRLIAAIILTTILILLGLVSIVSGLLSGQRPEQIIGSACIGLVPMLLFGLQLTWLIQALRSGARMQAMQSQYQQQYWQYAQQQQQQMYGQVPPPSPNVQTPTSPPPPPQQGERNEPPPTS